MMSEKRLVDVSKTRMTPSAPVEPVAITPEMTITAGEATMAILTHQKMDCSLSKSWLLG